MDHQTLRQAEALNDEKLENVAGGYNGQLISSGSFVSQTGTSLNLLVSWEAASDGFGQKTLYITVSALSSSLQCAALPNTLEIIVNGMSYVTTPNAIDYHGGGSVSHVLGGCTVPNAYGPASITASWRFNGVIGGVPLGTITVTGMANF